MANPRLRDRLQQVPNAAPPAAIPSIPNVRSGIAEVDAAFAAVKQAMDVRNGVAGNPWEQWVTQRDLADLGLVGPLVSDTAPSDALALPVWSSRAAYTLVSINTLKTILGGGTGTAGSTDLTQLNNQVADLGRRLATLSTQVDPVVLQQTIAAAVNTVTAASGARTFTQTVASLTWTIVHNFGRPPLITAFDATGTKIEPDVVNTDPNTTVLTHGRATAGTAVYQ